MQSGLICLNLLWAKNKLENNGEWKTTNAKFQGYVKAKLEDIELHQKAHAEQFVKIYDKLEQHQSSIERMKVKWSIVAGGVATIVSLVMIWLKKIFM